MAKRRSRSRVSSVKRRVTKAAGKVMGKARDLENKAKRELVIARQKFTAGERKAKAYLKNNPQKAALIAAGIGAAIGAGITAALRRKRR